MLELTTDIDVECSVCGVTLTAEAKREDRGGWGQLKAVIVKVEPCEACLRRAKEGAEE